MAFFPLPPFVEEMYRLSVLVICCCLSGSIQYLVLFDMFQLKNW